MRERVRARGELFLREAALARWKSSTTARGSTRSRRSGGSRPARRESGATPTSCPSPGARRPAGAGADAALARRPAGRAARVDAEIWVKNDAANPTHSFKDRVVAVAVAKAQELGFDDRRLRLDRQPRQRGRCPRRRRRLDSYVFVPANLEEQKLLATGVYGPTSSASAATTTTSTGSAPSSPRPTRGPSSTSTCAPTTPRARRRSPTRPSSSSAGAARPRRQPDRLRLAFTKLGRGFQEWIDLGLVAGEQPTFNGAQAEAAARSPPPSPKAGTSASRSAPTRSPRAWRSATRPTAPTRSSTRGGPGAASTRSPTPEIRWDQTAGGDDRDLHRDRRRGHRRRPSQARRTGRDL